MAGGEPLQPEDVGSWLERTLGSCPPDLFDWFWQIIRRVDIFGRDLAHTLKDEGTIHRHPTG